MVLCVKRTSEENRLMFWIRRRVLCVDPTALVDPDVRELHGLRSLRPEGRRSRAGVRRSVPVLQGHDRGDRPAALRIALRPAAPQARDDEEQLLHALRRGDARHHESLQGAAALRDTAGILLLGAVVCWSARVSRLQAALLVELRRRHRAAGDRAVLLGSVQLFSMGSREVHRFESRQVRKRPYVIEKERVNFEYPPGKPRDERSTHATVCHDGGSRSSRQLALAGIAETARRRQERRYEGSPAARGGSSSRAAGISEDSPIPARRQPGWRLRHSRTTTRFFGERRIEGVPVLNPADAVSRYDYAFFVVAIYNGTPVRHQLGQLGCQRVVPYPLFFWEFWRWMPREDRLELPHRILSYENDFRAA